ncbi:MAG: hypothetical protein ACJ8DE_08660, partial [Microvirga sp.]
GFGLRPSDRHISLLTLAPSDRVHAEPKTLHVYGLFYYMIPYDLPSQDLRLGDARVASARILTQDQQGG